MKAIQQARSKRLEEHREIVNRLGESKVMISTWCGCFSYAWVHDPNLGVELVPYQEIEKLADETVEESYRIDPSQLSLGQELGRGGNGSVYVASYCGVPVAVKELHIQSKDKEDDGNNMGKSFEEMDRERELKLNAEFEREFENLKRIRHPNVVDLYGTAILETNDHSFRRVLTMELAACSMRDVLRNEVQPAPMGTALVWAKEIAAGLAFLHSRQLIHFDIKPANILIDFSGRAKICDLGVAKVTSIHSPTSLTFTNSARVGTPSYMAPELLRADVARITNSVDVYSYAVLLWEVLHRENPHPKSWGIPQLFRQVAVNKHRPEIESDVPPAFATLIELCWSEVPAKRPPFDTIVKVLNYLVPAQIPTLVSTSDESVGEHFYLWEPEAKCFLADCLFDSHSNGLLNIEFADGQPGQHGVDPRNVVLAREIQDVLEIDPTLPVSAASSMHQVNIESDDEEEEEEEDYDDSALFDTFNSGEAAGWDSPNYVPERVNEPPSTSQNTATRVTAWLKALLAP